MFRLLIISMIFIVLAGCAGSPYKAMSQSVEELYQDVYLASSFDRVCRLYKKVISDPRAGEYPSWAAKHKAAQNRRLMDINGSVNDCENPSKFYSRQAWISEEYNIDGLSVLKMTARNVLPVCASGNFYFINLKGTIGPDSSFTLEKLLQESQPCRDLSGNIIQPVTVNLESNGGLLEDGYRLGRSFRKFDVKTEILDNKVCASSCAVAFLGGATRLIREQGLLMFHAPYFDRLNSKGKRDPDCNVGARKLSEMNDYYVEMTDSEVGARIFDRTMWYCSAEDGWTITGGSAAQLYGLATDKSVTKTLFQDIDNLTGITVGMRKDTLKDVMGKPAYFAVVGKKSEMHYCKTGMSDDEFVAFHFFNDQLTRIQRYSVNWEEANYMTGSCENFVKLGSYNND